MAALPATLRCVSRVSDAALCIVDDEEYGTSIDSVLVLFGTGTSTALVLATG